MVSNTVTNTFTLLIFPLLSSAVSVTVFNPRLLQLNAFGVAVSVFIAQLSVLPLSNMFAVMLTNPPLFVYTVMFLGCNIGASVSSIVTVAEAVPVFPLLSLTVSNIELMPRLLQSNVSGDTSYDAIPQLSLDALSTNSPSIVANPFG